MVQTLDVIKSHTALAVSQEKLWRELELIGALKGRWTNSVGRKTCTLRQASKPEAQMWESVCCLKSRSWRDLSWHSTYLACLNSVFNPQRHINYVWWYTWVIPALRRWRQEAQKFKVIFATWQNWGLPGIHETMSQNKYHPTVWL